MIHYAVPALLVAMIVHANSVADADKPVPGTEALKLFNVLIGKWNGAGVPDGPPEKRQEGHWSETIDWRWKFKDKDAWIVATFEKGKYFTGGELRPLAEPNAFELKLTTLDKKELVFQGLFKERYLIVERTDTATKDTERLTFALLHSNRMTYTHEVKPAGKTFYTKLYRVGATKDGEPFVTTGFNEKQCAVSGGQGTTAVAFDGKTYYVCCSGCKEAFDKEPAKYAAEFEKKRLAFELKK